LSLRYFYEEMPDLHIIAAGSMLEFTLGSISFPVGRVSFEWTWPMTFHEFLNASDRKILADKLPSISDFEPIGETIHLKILEQLRFYFLVGGMPEAVKRYCKTGSLSQSFMVHEEIFQSYLQSLVKYNQRADVDSLDYLLRSLPSQVGRQIKYTRLDPERRIEKTKRSLQLLERALLLHIIRSSNAEGLPLNAGASSKIMKPLFLDLGLMQYHCGIHPSDILNEKDLSKVYRGALAEQFVGQEMLAAGGSENFKMFYWSRAKKSSSAEVDYLYVRNGKIFPVEVKAGRPESSKVCTFSCRSIPMWKRDMSCLRPFLRNKQRKTSYFCRCTQDLLENRKNPQPLNRHPKSPLQRVPLKITFPKQIHKHSHLKRIALIWNRAVSCRRRYY